MAPCLHTSTLHVTNISLAHNQDISDLVGVSSKYQCEWLGYVFLQGCLTLPGAFGSALLELSQCPSLAGTYM